MTEAKISTPCVNQCGIDPANGLCRGCQRSRAEIVAWRSLDEDQRRAIMRLLPERASIQPVGSRGEHVVADLGADGHQGGD